MIGHISLLDGTRPRRWAAIFAATCRAPKHSREQFAKLQVGSEMHAEASGGERFDLATTRWGWRLLTTHWRASWHPDSAIFSGFCCFRESCLVPLTSAVRLRAGGFGVPLGG